MSEHDDNINRLFAKIDDIRETVTTMRSDVVIVSTKIDDFSFRLKKLEDRDERHIEREEKIERLMARMEAVVEKSEEAVSELESRVDELEKDVGTLKNNWKWVVAIAGTIGSVAGSIFATVIEMLKG